jgi:benzodiazapine receptor
MQALIDGDAAKAPRLCGISLQQMLNLAGYLVFLLMSSLGGAGALGKSIGAVSNGLPTAITPAGWAFSIWSAIFVLTGALSLLQALPSRREWAWKKLGWWWAANTLIGELLWTPAWVFQWGGMWVSAALLAFVVATLAAITLRADTGVAPLAGMGLELLPVPLQCCPLPLPAWCTAALTQARPPRTWVEAALLEPAISLYMGWTTAAAILNVTIALVDSGVPAAGPAAAPLGVLLLLTAAALAVAAAALRTDYVYAGALSWALAGIYSQQQGTAWPVRFDSVRSAAALGAGVAGGAALAALGWRLWLWRSGQLLMVGGEGEEGFSQGAQQFRGREPALLSEVA